MTKISLCAFLLAAFCVAACSESSTPAEPAAVQSETAATQANTPQGVIPQGQLDAMAKAADVSNVLEQAEQERRKQMEAQGL